MPPSRHPLLLLQPVLLLLLLAATVTAQNPVVFENNTPACNCVPLPQCPSLLPPSGGRITYQQSARIQQLKCGFVNRSIKVCCPDRAASGPTTTAPPAPSPELPLSCGHSAPLDKIHGGNVAALGAHPWMVALGYTVPVLGKEEIQFLCGGTLITNQHVVTAAHCVHPSAVGSSGVEQLNIGEWNTESDPDCITLPNTGRSSCAPPVVVRQPGKTTWHPQYNSNGLYNNDIAVIRLNEPVQFGPYIQPICIPTSFDPRISTPNHPNGLATGWGSTETETSSPLLREVRLPFVDIAVCNKSFQGVLTDGQICAGGEAGRDSCRGDSGGPLITIGRFGPPYALVGLTSFGRQLCGMEDNYAVYTSVSKFRDWILQSL